MLAFTLASAGRPAPRLVRLSASLSARPSAALWPEFLIRPPGVTSCGRDGSRSLSARSLCLRSVLRQRAQT